MKKINAWATQWKMSFNPDPTKEVYEVIFSRKIKKPLHTSLNFKNTNVKQIAFQKHLRFILDSQISLQEHLKTIVKKVNKTIGLICKLCKEVFLTKNTFNDSLEIFYTTSSWLWKYHFQSAIQ